MLEKNSDVAKKCEVAFGTDSSLQFLNYSLLDKARIKDTKSFGATFKVLYCTMIHISDA